jgi:hypothetical protein
MRFRPTNNYYHMRKERRKGRSDQGQRKKLEEEATELRELLTA